jgi:hypothetical protein
MAGPKLDLNINEILSIALAAPKIVKGIRAIFGKDKTGPEKLEMGADILDQSIGITNALAGKEVVSKDGAKALAREAIQIAYDMEKMRKRLMEIDDLVRAAKGSGQAPLIGEDGLG